MASRGSSRSSEPSLKGILSTNDDPDLCALCLGELPMPTGSAVLYCCGKGVCDRCVDSGFSAGSACPLCKSSSPQGIGALKKHAKKGRPWAQYHLGLVHIEGCRVPESDFEAVRWLRKASKQGHPGAFLFLSHHHIDGIGCALNLSEAKKCAEHAMSIHGPFTAKSCDLLLRVAAAYSPMKTVEARKEMRSILAFLVGKGMRQAQCGLAMMLRNEDKDYHNAEKLFALAALQGDVHAAHGAAVSCWDLGEYARANFWSKVFVKTKGEGMDPDRREECMEKIENIQLDLRRLRDNCGGCGAALDGKTRLYCKGCKTYCYCGRDCQKLHWNRIGCAQGTHRDECLEVRSLKEKMKGNML